MPTKSSMTSTRKRGGKVQKQSINLTVKEDEKANLPSIKFLAREENKIQQPSIKFNVKGDEKAKLPSIKFLVKEESKIQNPSIKLTVKGVTKLQVPSIKLIYKGAFTIPKEPSMKLTAKKVEKRQVPTIKLTLKGRVEKPQKPPVKIILKGKYACQKQPTFNEDTTIPNYLLRQDSLIREHLAKPSSQTVDNNHTPILAKQNHLTPDQQHAVEYCWTRNYTLACFTNPDKESEGHELKIVKMKKGFVKNSVIQEVKQSIEREDENEQVQGDKWAGFGNAWAYAQRCERCNGFTLCHIK